MWKPAQDGKGAVGPEDCRVEEGPSQRRRWDAISGRKHLHAHLEYSQPRSSRWDPCTQVASEIKPHRACMEHTNNSSSSRNATTHWDVSTQVPSEPKQRSSHMEYIIPLRPSRIAGGSGCNCCSCSPVDRPVESCLAGLHQKYVDVYDSNKCKEGHLPAGYRSFVEHDDLYLPPSRAMSPASTDHDDLYLPLKTSCDDYSPRDCCPCDLRMCDSDPTYGDIYLPPSRPCTPAFPKDPCGYPPPCNPCPPPCNPCPPPCNPCPPPPSCGPKVQCSCSPYIKKLPPCPAPACPPPDCSCPPYIKKMPGSCSGSVTTCRPLLGAEMLSGIEACTSNAKVSGRNPASCMDPRCLTCDCHKPKCPPSPARSPPCSPCRPPPPSPPCSPCRPPPPSCRASSSFDDVHNPTFESSSPRCKDCDCHKPKNCKFSTQVCKFCRGSGYCDYYTTQQQLSSQGSPTSERILTPHEKGSCMQDMERSMVALQITGSTPEDTYRSNYKLPAKTAKVEFESPCSEESEPTPRTLVKEILLERTQLCCCGKCQHNEPRFPIHIQCPFCKHVNSCCCGMCCCPVLTCPSKTPLALDSPTPRLSLTSSGGQMGPSNPRLYNPRRKSSFHVTRTKGGFASPDKCTSKSPYSKTNSSARVCSTSPCSRRRPSQQQSPTRR